MPMTLTVFELMVTTLIRGDTDELSTLRMHRLIKAAMERYSHDRPDVLTADITGDGGKFYPVAASLTSYVDGFSRITAIEYPAVTIASDDTPQYLTAEDWREDYYDGTTRYLWLPNHAPSAAETLRVTFAAPYAWAKNTSATTAVNQDTHGFSVDDFVFLDTVPATDIWTSSIDSRPCTHQVTVVTDADNFTAAMLEVDPPAGDYFAICNLAAGMACQAIADQYSRTSDSTIALDSVDHPARAAAFAERSRELIGYYNEHLGIGEDGELTPTAGAAVFMDVDTMPGWPTGRQFLFRHGGTR